MRTTEDIQTRAGDVGHQAGQWLEDAGYVTLGVASFVIDVGRNLPRHVDTLATRTPLVLVDAFEDLNRRGRDVAARVRRDPSIARARRSARKADREVREAADSLKKAGKAEVRAAKSTADDVRKGNIRYQDLTVDELQELAAERDIEGRSSMRKRELVRALQNS